MAQLTDREDAATVLCEVVGHERIALDDTDSCNIDNTNTLSFKILLFIGAVFTCLSGLISFYMDKVGPRLLVGECPQ